MYCKGAEGQRAVCASKDKTRAMIFWIVTACATPPPSARAKCISSKKRCEVGIRISISTLRLLTRIKLQVGTGTSNINFMKFYVYMYTGSFLNTKCRKPYSFIDKNTRYIQIPCSNLCTGTAPLIDTGTVKTKNIKIIPFLTIPLRSFLYIWTIFRLKIT